MHACICHGGAAALYSAVGSTMLCVGRAVIKTFGVQIGADQKQVQGLIRLAKKNGEKLGFLS